VAVTLCIATSYTADFRDIGDYAAMSIRAYAARHRADAFIEPTLVFDERPPAWHRVRLIPTLFDCGYEFVLWVDADAVFLRYDVDVRSVIKARKDLYLVEHAIPEQEKLVRVPNTGVMLLRNSEWTRAFLDRIWRMAEYAEHKWWENAAVVKALGYHSLLDEGDDVYNHDLLRRVSFLPLEWNSLPGVCAAPNPIVQHYAGQPADVRRRELPRDALKGCYAAAAEAFRLGATRAPPRWWKLISRLLSSHG
jgi:hypothetical protein